MINPKISGIPGAGMMTDTLDFVKSLWGNIPGINVPGMVVPTMSVEDLDKKIGDLKAVESWLNVNMSMLRSTIQGMEVQRATIATLKAMSATLAGGAKPADAAAAGKSPFEGMPFASAFSFPPAAEPAAAPAAPAAAAEAEKTESQPDTSAQMANPSAWWNLLQQQFQHAVSSAMTSSDAVTKLGEVGTAMATDAASKLAAAIPKPVKPAASAAKPAPKAAAKAAPAVKSAAAKPKAAARKRSTPKG